MELRSLIAASKIKFFALQLPMMSVYTDQREY